MNGCLSYQGYISVWNGRSHKRYYLANAEETFNVNIKRGDRLKIQKVGEIGVSTSMTEMVNGKVSIMIHGYLVI
jgi:hypothetical protein